MKRRQLFQAALVGFFCTLVPAELRAFVPKTHWHSNLFEMFDAIWKHAKETGDNIIINDDPRNKALGFAALSGETLRATWKINLSDAKMRKSPPIVTWPPRKVSIVEKYVRTSQGRTKLAESLTREGKQYYNKVIETADRIRIHCRQS